MDALISYIQRVLVDILISCYLYKGGPFGCFSFMLSIIQGVLVDALISYIQRVLVNALISCYLYKGGPCECSNFTHKEGPFFGCG